MTAARALAPSPQAPTAYVPLDAIVVAPAWNARRVSDPAIQDSIYQSMIDLLTAGKHPQLSPVEVTTRADRYELIAGFTRIALLRDLATPDDDGSWSLPAALLARPEARAWLEAPTAWILVTDATTDAESRIANLAENTRRQPMHPADLAVAIAELLPSGRKGQKARPGDLTAEMVGARLGLDHRYVSNLARVGRTCTPEQISALRQGGITVRDALALVASEPDERARAWEAFKTTGKLPKPAKPARSASIERDAADHGRALDQPEVDAAPVRAAPELGAAGPTTSSAPPTSPEDGSRSAKALGALEEDHRIVVLDRFGSAPDELLVKVAELVRHVVDNTDEGALSRARELSQTVRPWDATSEVGRVYHLTLAAIIAEQPTTRLAARRELEAIVERKPGGRQAALFETETDDKPPKGKVSKRPEPKAKASKKPEPKGKASKKREPMPRGNVRGGR